MSLTTAVEVHWPDLRRARCAVVVVDMVESVRLMQAHEVQVIERWRRLVHGVQTEVLPVRGGRMVKHQGDGMQLVFDAVPDAAAAIIALHQRAAHLNEGVAQDAQIWLRVGAHETDLVYVDIDTYGSGVNLAARLVTLAEPGETVVTADFKQSLVPGLDADAQDLGERQLKHIEGTIRVFRLGPSAPPHLLPAFDTLSPARPTIAVLPFQAEPSSLEVATLGEILCNGVIGGLSLSSHWRVISRLSALAFRDRRLSMIELAKHLRCDFVLSGQCRRIGGRLRVDAELAEASSGTVAWAGTVEGTDDQVLSEESPLVHRLVDATAAAIFAHELRRARSHSLPTLSSHTLLFGAVALMHRLSRNDFDRSRQMLEHLCERHPRSPEPHAWRAKWHVMKVAQGWGSDVQAERELAGQSARRALDEVSDHSLALAVDGLVAAFLTRDLETSGARYDAAISANPNESLAWLFQSALAVYSDRGEVAARAADTALWLSPLDPMRYYYDSFAAHAYVAGGRLDDAIRLAERSLRANCTHLPTFRTLVVALALAGRGAESRAVVRRMQALDPTYSVSRFRATYPGAGSRHAQVCADALAEAGLPD